MPTLRSCHVHSTFHGLYVWSYFLKVMLTPDMAQVKGKGKDNGKAQPLKTNDKGKGTAQAACILTPVVPTLETVVSQTQIPNCGQKRALTGTPNTMTSKWKRTGTSLPHLLTMTVSQWVTYLLVEKIAIMWDYLSDTISNLKIHLFVLFEKLWIFVHYHWKEFEATLCEVLTLI